MTYREPFIRFRRRPSRIYRWGLTRLWGTKEAPHGPVLIGQPRVWTGLLINTRWFACIIIWMGR